MVLSGDDTFSAPSSQVYMYTAANGQAVWDDTGHLYALTSATATINDYGDLAEGESVGVEFVMVPDAIADGGQTDLESWSND
ncbi:MAG: hypothetical protein OEV72_08940, partial [Thermoleophilia bacterium]|nr:hypothetical protein [Thermoleophilia bacterium]